MKAIRADTFTSELRAAGLLGLPFSWSQDGELFLPDDFPQREAVEAVLAAHDPTKPLDTFDADLAALLTDFRAQRDVVLPRCLGIKDAFRDSAEDGTPIDFLGRAATAAEFLQIKAAVATVRQVQIDATSHPTVLAAVAARDAAAVDTALRTQWAMCVIGLPTIAKIAFAKVDK